MVYCRRKGNKMYSLVQISTLFKVAKIWYAVNISNKKSAK